MKLRKRRPKEANPWVDPALGVCSPRFAECFPLPSCCGSWHKGWGSVSPPALACVPPGDADAAASPLRTPCPPACPCPCPSPQHSGLTQSSYSPILQLCGLCPLTEHRSLVGWPRGSLGTPEQGGLAQPSPCKATSPPPPFLEEIMQIRGDMAVSRAAGIAFGYGSGCFSSLRCFRVSCRG